MKLTKQLEAEVLQAYHAYWDSYLKGDMKTFSSLLDENCHIIGSTAFDVFDDRASAVKFYTATAEQISGKTEFRNRKIKLLPYQDSVMAQELCDYYFLGDEEWNFYGHGRLSTLLSKKEGCWKIIHQHGSLPDFRAEEGEQVATEKIRKENRELREAVKRRTVEIESKNRELQIEFSLERVRTVAMSMNKTADMLDVCHIISGQLEMLGTKEIRNVQTAILYEDKGIYINYEYYRLHDKSLITEVDYRHDTMMSTFASKMQKGAGEFFTEKLTGEVLKDWFEYQKTTPQFADPHQAEASSLNYYWLSLGAIGLGISTYAPLNEEEIQLFQRFRNVFELCYRRFLDIEIAGIQAREAQIELALERVRARTMAMQQSDELAEAASLLFQQVKSVGIETFSSGYTIWANDDKDLISWMCNADGSINPPFVMPINADIRHVQLYESWKAGEALHIEDMSGETMQEHYRYLRSYPLLDEAFEKSIAAGYTIPERQVHNSANFSHGNLLFITYEAYPQYHDIFIRFAKVFDQTYTRFLDLQKAEAQAREATIEAALEKIRSRSLGMHHSIEIKDVVAILFEKLKELHLAFDGGAAIHLFSAGSRNALIWVATPDLPEPTCVNLPYDENAFENNPIIMDVWNAKETGEHIYNKLYSFEEKNIYFNYVFTHNNLITIPDSSREFIRQANSYTASFIAGKNSLLGANSWTGQLFSDKDIEVLKRVGRVFEQAYIRFLDLQKAEAQAREAKIEASLERVRASAMAMHSSDDVSTATATMFTELKKLGIDYVRGGILNIRKDQTMEVWSVNTLDDGRVIRAVGLFDMTLHPFWQQLYKEWENKAEFYYYFMAGKVKEDYIRILNARPDYILNGIQQIPDSHIQLYYFGEGFVWTFSLQPHPEEANQVMKRFTSVFSLTFRRYQDLKKAEEQAREARIETVMEKVRARALAMEKPDELIEVAQLLRKEMSLLGVEELETSSIYIHNEETGKIECWYAIKDIKHPEKELVSDHITIDLNETWVGRQMFEFYHSDKKQISIIMQGANRKEWINYCAGHSKVLVGFYGDDIPDRTYHLYKFSNGYMGAASPGDISAESWDLLQRATSVFSLAHTRFSDLQQAEASTREAVKQATLDRVRAEIASMRTATDLERITPLIWNELTILGVPFIRCGVFIMDDEHELIHTFLSTPDGNAIAAFNIPYTTPGNIAAVLSHWQHTKIYTDHWDEAAFTEFAGTLVKQGVLTSPEQYLKTLPRGGFYLHFLPFLQGMLYVGNTTQLSDDDIKLIQSIANAFSTAYARYEDFNKLEKAKKQVDSTLNELQAAQKQLIQSEKMASLGDLTAGIAHEIQNPLNFVNNFSEVNKELLAEMNEEIEKGNYDGVKAIANDVTLNQEKINHHGKRADAIVKGMLQHSRSSNGQKELTDLNSLVDEYLRLSYHGLRAKDKTFNATLKTDYDDSIGNISIIPQDIGRAILNLITNAFYAVTEKKKLLGENYEPVVMVKTSLIPPSESAGAMISIRDNGPGIPQNLLDKIFQPFFTTKPTGHGTGLGLSLAYDIVKAHGGKLTVETQSAQAEANGGKERIGSEFIIQLPVV